MTDEWILSAQRALLPGYDRPGPACAWIRDGQFAEVLAGTASPLGHWPPVERLEVASAVVMPGLVDTHAHINEPGRTDWEGFRTATRAAAAGGITTVVDMPLNSLPPTVNRRALESKRDAASGQCWIDYAFWAGVIPGNGPDLEPLARAGVAGFKAFLIHSGVDEFPMSDPACLRQAARALARLRVPLIAHAERDSSPAPRLEDSRSYGAYVESRPSDWEVSAVRELIGLSRGTGCAIHVVHLSAADALADLRGARAAGVRVTAETCPHYLALAAEDIPDGATHFKCAPPIRGQANQELLWAGLLDGTLDMIVSDHSPCAPKLKDLEGGRFDRAWGGIAGLQFSLPVVWSAMRNRDIPISHLTSWMCEAPARLAGMERRKGRIAPGYDADLVLWDPEASFIVTLESILHRHSVTPYAGRRLHGRVLTTYLRGRRVFDVNRGFPESADGREIRRPPTEEPRG